MSRNGAGGKLVGQYLAALLPTDFSQPAADRESTVKGAREGGAGRAAAQCAAPHRVDAFSRYC